MDNNHTADTQQATVSNSNQDNTNPRAIRTSARVRAAKDKAKAKEPEQQDIPPSHSASASVARLTRSVKGKGKADPEPHPRKKTRRSAPALTINEPPKDPKGKKRAISEPSSEEETSSASPKRPRTSSYSLRSLGSPLATNTAMPRKSRNSNSKAKSIVKSKMNSPGPSQMQDDEDVDMVDMPVGQEGVADASDHEVGDARADNAENSDNDGPPKPGKLDSGAMEDDDDEDEGDDGHMMGGGDGISGGLDEATTLAMFGDYRQFGSFMLSIGSRLKTMLNNIKKTADPTTRLLTLQELSELLSICTEDTLAGSFPVEQFVSELVKILGGRGTDEEDDEGDEDQEPKDEDAALAAALAMSTGGNAFQGDENPEAQVLACRCLANLMEALPGVAHTVVYHGAIPVLCSKLIEISYIDLAEQTLSTIEKISEEFPSAIVREGGLAALLNYLDFFSIAVQRTALQAAANCCRNISSDHFTMIQGVWPIIRNCLSYSDQRLVEFACLCIIRVIDSYHRSSIEHLETLIDIETIRAINNLLLPAGGTSMISSNTFTLLLRALATVARASATVTINLLEAGIVDTLYQILTGVLPPSGPPDSEASPFSSQGLGGGIGDMTVMETLAHRPKDQVDETLSLVSELMPPLPKDGVFDHRSYTEKALSRLVKAKAKADRASAKQAAQAAQAQLHAALLLGPPSSSRASESTTPPAAVEEPETSNTPASVPNDRSQLLRSSMLAVGRFIQLTVPVLIDVYSATVSIPLRIKALSTVLKATSFLDGDELENVFLSVPVATFISSILSSKDHPSLIIGALQLVEMLLAKNATLFKPSFRREGVFHEIEAVAERTITSKKDKDQDSTSQDSNPPPAPPIPIPSSLKKLSSLSLDPEDAITLRARIVRFKHFSTIDKTEENSPFEQLQKLVSHLSKTDSCEKDVASTLRQLANHFNSTNLSVSSFEVLQSGVVDAVLEFTLDPHRKLSISKRRELFLNAFFPKNTPPLQSPMTIFVKKLQESLTRIESFDVVTVTQGYDDSKRSSPSLLARQLRLRLVADEDSDIPKGLQNIVVSIHAIATFQALHDYLRPRVAGVIGTSVTPLSGMLAALTASYGALARGENSASTSTSILEDGGEGSSASAALHRRRSRRLSAKQEAEDRQDDSATKGASPAVPGAGDPPEKESKESNSLLQQTDAIEPELHPDMSDEEIDAEVFEDDQDGDTSMSDRTVTLSVAEGLTSSFLPIRTSTEPQLIILDGTNVEAQTPDGTRVATPNPSTFAQSASAAEGASSRQSYAAALKTKSADWHIEFFMEDQELPLDLTIYGAIHQHEMRKHKGSFPPSLIWQGLYTVKFKKVPGPPRDVRSDAELPNRSRTLIPSLSCLPEDAPQAKILRLLRALYQLNATSDTVTPKEVPRLPESVFINNKLSAKLTRQLEEPMIVASQCLPEWAQDLPQHFSFLFPFSTRYNFLQSTSFGYARLIMKWQTQNGRNQDTSRRDDGIGFLGRLQRQKVRVSRKHILESAVKVFELYGSSSSVLEVEYFEEVGTGLGPTLEFYSLVSREFSRKDLKIWRDDDANNLSTYVSHRQGLYPAPISPAEVASDGGQKRAHLLRVIGQFVAKAMLDSRIIDLHFNRVFLKLVLEEEVPATISTLQLVDSELANSLSKMESIIHGSSPSSDKYLRKLGIAENPVKIEDLALDFTIPGYDIELRPGGADIVVTSENAHEYIQEVLDAIVGSGAHFLAKAFRDGFSKVFNVSDLQLFSAEELVLLFGNSDEDWSMETLNDALKADHGFHMESGAIRHLLNILTEYDAVGRRNFLQFITGSPKLPIGGFRGLNPPLTIVRKPHEAPLTADDYLPSVMTCVNYLKLPEYSSKEIMRERLKTAIHEGKSSFHLS